MISGYLHDSVDILVNLFLLYTVHKAWLQDHSIAWGGDRINSLYCHTTHLINASFFLYVVPDILERLIRKRKIKYLSSQGRRHSRDELHNAVWQPDSTKSSFIIAYSLVLILKRFTVIWSIFKSKIDI